MVNMLTGEIKKQYYLINFLCFFIYIIFLKT